jgi:Fic family protein
LFYSAHYFITFEPNNNSNRLMVYNWQLTDWRQFQYEETAFTEIALLEEGEGTFIGGMNARKYQAISHLSKATATRHLQDLVEKGILVSENGGRSTNYQVNLT